MGSEHAQSLIAGQLSLLTTLAVLWKTPFTGLVFTGPDLELALIISSCCLTSQLPVSVITVGANKKLTKNLTKIWGIRYS